MREDKVTEILLLSGNEQIIANDFYRQAVQETISASKAVVEMHKEKCMAQGVKQIINIFL